MGRLRRNAIYYRTLSSTMGKTLVDKTPMMAVLHHDISEQIRIRHSIHVTSLRWVTHSTCMIADLRVWDKMVIIGRIPGEHEIRTNSIS